MPSSHSLPPLCDCLAHRTFFDPAAKRQKLIEFGVVHFRDTKASLLEPLDEAIGCQQAQRLPDWRGAYAIMVTQQLDFQLEPGAEAAADNIVANPIVDVARCGSA